MWMKTALKAVILHILACFSKKDYLTKYLGRKHGGR